MLRKRSFCRVIDSRHHNIRARWKYPDQWFLEDYSRDIVGEATPFYRPEDAYVGELISAVRALDAGITTIMDISRCQTRRSIAMPASKACRTQASARCSPMPGASALKRSIRRMITGAERPLSSTDELLTLAMGTQMIQEQWGVARKAGVRIFSHAVGRAASDTDPKWGQAGWLRADNVGIHFTSASAEFMKMIAATGGGI